MDHEILRNLLRKKIKDERLISLVIRGCKSKILTPDGGTIKNNYGVPQGGVCSPILSNIYLHELDSFMRKYCSENNFGLQRPHNPVYRRVAKVNKSRKVALKLGHQPADYHSNSYRRMAYVRYADDFLVSIAADRNTAELCRKQIGEFLQETLKLELNISKTLITNVSPTNFRSLKKAVSFLGYLISMHPGVIRRSPKGLRRRTGKGHVVIKANKSLIIRRLHEKGFCKKDGTPIPNFIFLSDTQNATNAKINRIFRGIINYYKLADNLKQFGCHLFYLFSFSLAKLYAAKFR
jgi:hypothetical protein